MKLIAAADKNWSIGKDGGLLCHLPGDLKYFKEKTLGKTVVMGRKTLDSLPGGKPLPGRTNVVLTRDGNFHREGCIVIHSIEELLSGWKSDDVMVIGGGSLYKELLPYCDTCYITRIDKEFEADTVMPDLDRRSEFEMVWQSEVQCEKGTQYRFTRYERK